MPPRWLVEATFGSQSAPHPGRLNMSDHRPRSMLVVSWCLLLLGYGRSLAEAAPAGPPMPWDGPLNVILASLSGTVAHVVITAGVVVTGLVFAFTEHRSRARRLFGLPFRGALCPLALHLLL